MSKALHIENLECRRLLASAAMSVIPFNVAAVEGEAQTIRIASISTGDALAIPSDFKVTIKFPGGKSVTPQVTADSDPGAFTVTLNKSFSVQGTYRASVVVTAGSLTKRITSKVVVADQPLTGTALLLAGMAGSAVSGAVATFNDPDGIGKARDYSATIDWSDKTRSRGTISGNITDGFVVSGKHEYKAGGVFVTSVTITELHFRGSKPITVTGQVNSATVAASSTQQLSGTGDTTITAGDASVTVGAGTLPAGTSATVTELSTADDVSDDPAMTPVGMAVKLSFGSTATAAATARPAGISAQGTMSLTDGWQFNIPVPELPVGQFFPYLKFSIPGQAVERLALVGHYVASSLTEVATVSANAISDFFGSVVDKATEIYAGVEETVASTVKFFGPPRLKIWTGSQFSDYSGTLPDNWNPCASTLVVIHGLFSNVEGAFGPSIPAIAAAGGYVHDGVTQVLGVDYNYFDDPQETGVAVGALLDELATVGLHAVDLEGHSNGTIVALAAAANTTIGVDRVTLLGGPIDGTPAASFVLDGVDLAMSAALYDTTGFFIPDPATAATSIFGINGPALEPNSGELANIRAAFQAARPGTSVVAVAGSDPNIIPASQKFLSWFDSKLGPAIFGTTPNDGIIPVTSALGESPSGSLVLSNISANQVFPLTHVQLESAGTVIGYVGAALAGFLPTLTADGTVVNPLADDGGVPPLAFGDVPLDRKDTQDLMIADTSTLTVGGGASYKIEVDDDGGDEDDSWISVPDSTTGTLAAGGMLNVPITIDTTGLDEGEHTGHVELCVPELNLDVEIPVTVNVIKPTSTDLVFVIDTTASMGPYIDSVKASATDLIDQLHTDDPDARIGIELYKDYQDSDYVTDCLLPFTTDADSAVAAIDSITISGGGDIPEAVFSGIEAAIQGSDGLGSFRGHGVQKELVVMGDAAPHDPETQTGYTSASVAADTEAADPVDISAIPLGSSSSAINAFTGLAAHNRGVLVQGDSSTIVASLENVISQITAPITNPPATKVDPRGIIANWTGALTRKQAGVLPSATFSVADRTFDTLRATIAIGSQQASGTFTGFVNADGKFNYTLKEPGLVATIAGTIEPGTSVMTGMVKIMQKGRSVVGPFRMAH